MDFILTLTLKKRFVTEKCEHINNKTTMFSTIITILIALQAFH